MPSCVICGKPLFCHDQASHPPPQQVDGVAQPCPLTKGAVWVHTIDDEGNDIAGLTAEVDGATKTTDKKSGIAAFDPLDAKTYTVKLGELGAAHKASYDPPAAASKPVGVSNGNIAYVVFELQRRAKLKIELVQQGKPGRVLKGAKLSLNGPEGDDKETAGEKGSADFGSRKAGPYKLSVVSLSQADAKLFKLPAAPVDIGLDPGDDITLPIELERDAHAKVRLKFKDDPDELPQAKFELRIGDTVAKAGDLADGLADLKALEEDAYELCFPEIDASEWAAA